jgi:nicastrin
MLNCVGVVIEEFDTTFKNRFYHSQYDDLTNVNTTAIVAAASLVARSLLILASGNLLRSDSPAVTSIKVIFWFISRTEGISYQ